ARWPARAHGPRAGPAPGPAPGRTRFEALRSCAGLLALGGFFLDPAVASLFEFERQLAPAGVGYAPRRQHVDVIGYDVIKKALVVRGDYQRAIGGTQAVHAFGHDAQGIDVQA